MRKHKPHWSTGQLALRQKASDLLIEIKDKAFAYIAASQIVNEYEVQQFILNEFRMNNLAIDKDPPIVAFGENTAFPHYFPMKETARQLIPGGPIMIDIWSKLNNKEAPFADITWMGYYGQPSRRFQDIYDRVTEARDTALWFLEERLQAGEIPTGREVDNVARNSIERAGFGYAFTHSTGHSIGLTSPHGIWGHIRRTNTQPLFTNLGYTIEPGIYLPGEFGIRSEINFYITDDLKLIRGTIAQKDLCIVS